MSTPAINKPSTRIFLQLLFLLAALVPEGAAKSRLFAQQPATSARQTLSFREAERQTQAIAEKVVAATVGIVLTADDIENDIGYGGSGVIVSPEGMILTAAHVLEGCDAEVLVLLEGHRQAKAKVLGYLGRGDLGLVQLVDPGPWPYLPMARIERVAPGTLCLGAGHTGRIDAKRRPPLRMGRVLGERQGESFVDENGENTELDRVLVTDAPFLPGDSGGPLVNLAGEVIGIHTSIGPDHRENLHVPIWQFHRHWEKLTSGVKRPLVKTSAEDGAAGPSQMGPLRKMPIFDYRITVERSWSRCHPNYLKQFSSFTQNAARSTVQVFVDDRLAGLGMVVDPAGQIVTVASNLGTEKNIVCRIDGRDYPAKLTADDEAQNVALLTVEARNLTPVDWSSEDVNALGAWLISADAGGKPLDVGVLGLQRSVVPDHHFNETDKRGFLGVELQVRARNAKIGKVVPQSAAAQAGLGANDVIHALNEHAIHQGEELVEALHKFQVGEKVKIEFSRDGKRESVEATLGRRPSQFEEDEVDFAPWCRSTGGTSSRKTNFPDVFTHDSFIRPTQCGGPVLDMQGRVVGMNIARVDRTATYAIPASVMAELVQRLKDQPQREQR